MARPSEDTQNLAALVDQFIAARNVSHRQYQQLSAMVLADGNIDEYERQQINRLFDAIQAGIVKVID